jgi:peptidoglycan/xylan/chitin deacetylase (PgdA/CDA1 family)
VAFENTFRAAYYRLDYMWDGGGFAFLKSLASSGVSYTQGDATATSVPVLVYHGILPKWDGTPTNISIDKFKEQLFALKRAGYETITSTDLLEYMQGKRILPEKSIVLSFDDGRQDSVRNGDPVLQALGMKAIMFVISGSSFGPPSNYYLSGAMLRQMQQSGRWDIEAHTDDGHGLYQVDAAGDKGQFFSYKLWLPDQNRLETADEFAARVVNDMKSVKKKIEDNLGKTPIAFTFPFGNYGQEATNFAGAQAITIPAVGQIYPLMFYQQAPGMRFTQNYSTKADSAKSSFFIRRIIIDPNWSGDDLLAQLESGHAKPLPYHGITGTDIRWIDAWGSISTAGGILSIEPSANENGGAAVLDGTRIWKDYSVKVKAEVPNRNGIFIWTRFADDANNIACNLGNGFAHIEQTVNGERRTIKGIRSPFIAIPAGDFTAEARVVGRTLSCYLNGTKLVETPYIDPRLDQGGIGFKTWDSAAGKSLLRIKDIDVEPIGPTTSTVSIAAK